MDALGNLRQSSGDVSSRPKWMQSSDKLQIHDLGQYYELI